MSTPLVGPQPQSCLEQLCCVPDTIDNAWDSRSCAYAGRVTLTTVEERIHCFACWLFCCPLVGCAKILIDCEEGIHRDLDRRCPAVSPEVAYARDQNIYAVRQYNYTTFQSPQSLYHR